MVLRGGGETGRNRAVRDVRIDGDGIRREGSVRPLGDEGPGRSVPVPGVSDAGYDVAGFAREQRAGRLAIPVEETLRMAVADGRIAVVQREAIHAGLLRHEGEDAGRRVDGVRGREQDEGVEGRGDDGDRDDDGLGGHHEADGPGAGGFVGARDRECDLCAVRRRDGDVRRKEEGCHVEVQLHHRAGRGGGGIHQGAACDKGPAIDRILRGLVPLDENREGLVEGRGDGHVEGGHREGSVRVRLDGDSVRAGDGQRDDTVAGIDGGQQPQFRAGGDGGAVGGPVGQQDLDRAVREVRVDDDGEFVPELVGRCVDDGGGGGAVEVQEHGGGGGRPAREDIVVALVGVGEDGRGVGVGGDDAVADGAGLEHGAVDVLERDGAGEGREGEGERRGRARAPDDQVERGAVEAGTVGADFVFVGPRHREADVILVLDVDEPAGFEVEAEGDGFARGVGGLEGGGGEAEVRDVGRGRTEVVRDGPDGHGDVVLRGVGERVGRRDDADLAVVVEREGVFGVVAEEEGEAAVRPRGVAEEVRGDGAADVGDDAEARPGREVADDLEEGIRVRKIDVVRGGGRGGVREVGDDVPEDAQRARDAETGGLETRP